MTEIKIQEELKPCPFCGGKPYLADAQHTMAGVDMIICQNCGCRMYSGTVNKWNHRLGERLAKIEVLEKIVEMHELSPKTYPDIIRDMIFELKEVSR